MRHEASFEMIGQSNADAFIRLDQLEVLISCYRFKSLIMMYFAFILEHFMWCFSPPSNFIHRFMRWYRWMAWRGLPTTNSFTRHSVSWAHLPNLLPCATAYDPFKKTRKFKWKPEIRKGAFELFIKISLKCHRELGQVSNKDPVSRIFAAEKISFFLRLLYTQISFRIRRFGQDQKWPKKSNCINYKFTLEMTSKPMCLTQVL